MRAFSCIQGASALVPGRLRVTLRQLSGGTAVEHALTHTVTVSLIRLCPHYMLTFLPPDLAGGPLTNMTSRPQAGFKSFLLWTRNLHKYVCERLATLDKAIFIFRDRIMLHIPRKGCREQEKRKSYLL